MIVFSRLLDKRQSTLHTRGAHRRALRDIDTHPGHNHSQTLFFSLFLSLPLSGAFTFSLKLSHTELRHQLTHSHSKHTHSRSTRWANKGNYNFALHEGYITQTE